MFINPEDKEKFYQGYHPVFCVVYDTDHDRYDTSASTEQHFKFNPWEVLGEDEAGKQSDIFKNKHPGNCIKINNIIQNRIYMNYDNDGKILCNYRREDL